MENDDKEVVYNGCNGSYSYCSESQKERHFMPFYAILCHFCHFMPFFVQNPRVAGHSPTHILREFLVLLEKNSIVLCTNSVEWVTEK